MANIFLSYDHDDAASAAPIVSALEKAGHKVWWDRNIHGGAQYNSEIEKAVADADALVVLWSERSVQSAWVRDEAAEGRERGKLVPASLDGGQSQRRPAAVSAPGPSASFWTGCCFYLLPARPPQRPVECRRRARRGEVSGRWPRRRAIAQNAGVVSATTRSPVAR